MTVIAELKVDLVTSGLHSGPVIGHETVAHDLQSETNASSALCALQVGETTGQPDGVESSPFPYLNAVKNTPVSAPDTVHARLRSRGPR